MPFDSVNFAIFIITFIVIYPLGGEKWRQRVLIIASAVFLATYLQNVVSLAALAGILVGGYLAALYGRKQGRITPGILVYILFSVVVFAILKKYQILVPLFGDILLQHTISIIGYSYMLFRQIHVIVDASQQTIPEIDFLSYLAYILSFLTLLAGPIQRYQPFRKQWLELGDHQIRLESALRALNRIAGGYVAVYVIAPLMLNLPYTASNYFLASPNLQSVINFYTYPLYVFFNFAGYCSIVIGLGRIVGFQIPENFDKPYLSRDPLDFWNRWHITLSQWLRDYVFTPFYKAMMMRSAESPILWAIVGYFITFLLAGMWHGTTVSFFVLGLIYGVGASSAKALELLIQKRYGRQAYKRFYNNRIVSSVSIILTLNFIAFSFIFIQNDYSPQITAWITNTIKGGT